MSAEPEVPRLRVVAEAGSDAPAPTSARADDEAAEVAALVALASLSGIGPAALLRVQDARAAVAAWEAVLAGHPNRCAELACRPMKSDVAQDMTRSARMIDPVALLDAHEANGRRVLTRGSPGYPARLAEDPAPPALLFAEGDLTALDGPAVAVVGTRNATRLGRELAAELGSALAAAGVSVVSGLALGIDGAAHLGAMEPPGLSGRPVGVIASGLDIVYPRRHAELHRRVAEAGLLLTETVLGERPSAWRFPARNRVIAGLVDAVVVVESRSAGGSMNTVSEALARGTTVLAVPGHPRAPASAGTNDLLFDGAGIVRSPLDVLENIGVAPAPEPATPSSGELDHTAAEDLVLRSLEAGPIALSEVVAVCGLDIEAASQALVTLEASGEVVRSGGWFERSGGPSALGGLGR